MAKINQPCWTVCRFKGNGSLDSFTLNSFAWTKKEAILLAEKNYGEPWATIKSWGFVALKIKIISL